MTLDQIRTILSLCHTGSDGKHVSVTAGGRRFDGYVWEPDMREPWAAASSGFIRVDNTADETSHFIDIGSINVISCVVDEGEAHKPQ
jgi:hypothetical protein